MHKVDSPLARTRVVFAAAVAEEGGRAISLRSTDATMKCSRRCLRWYARGSCDGHFSKVLRSGPDYGPDSLMENQSADEQRRPQTGLRPAFVPPRARCLRPVTPDLAAAIGQRKLPEFPGGEVHHKNFTFQRLVAPTGWVEAAKGGRQGGPTGRPRSYMTNGRNDLARVTQNGGGYNDRRLDSLPAVLACGRGGFTFGPRDDTRNDFIDQFGLAAEFHKSTIRVSDRL